MLGDLYRERRDSGLSGSALRRESPMPWPIQQVRAVDVGKSNVDIGIVYRRGTQSEGSAVAEHDRVSEVYHILDGSATLVTGPDIVDWKRRPADNENVRLLEWPRGNGALRFATARRTSSRRGT